MNKQLHIEIIGNRNYWLCVILMIHQEIGVINGGIGVIEYCIGLVTSYWRIIRVNWCLWNQNRGINGNNQSSFQE